MLAESFVFRPRGPAREGELVLPEGQPRALTILCHGIPSGSPPAPGDEGYAGLARSIAGHGYAAAWFGFSGCKGEPGEFSAASWSEDLSAAVDSLKNHRVVGSLDTVIVGSSMGGDTAIDVAARRPDIAAVATLAAPASLGAIVDAPDEFLHRARNVGIIHDPAYPPDVGAWAAEFEAVAALSRIPIVGPRPVLLIHGDADEVVPYGDAEALFEAAAPPKELIRIERGAHQLRRDPRALDALVDWLDRLPLSRTSYADTGPGSLTS